VFQKLLSLGGSEGEEGAGVSGELKPAVPVNKAFGADKSLPCVRKGFTTLKKHIAVSHQMTPKEYRKRSASRRRPPRRPEIFRSEEEDRPGEGLATKLAKPEEEAGKKS